MNYIELYSPAKRAQVQANNALLASLQELESNTEQREFNKTPTVPLSENNEQQNGSTGWSPLIELSSRTAANMPSTGTYTNYSNIAKRPAGVTLGEWNNNYWNMRYGEPWRNSSKGAGGFARFNTVEDGARAAVINLNTYYNRGLDTINEIISSWAPSTENDTQNYINIVASKMHKDPNEHINIKDAKTIEDLLHAMAKVEIGKDIDRSIIREGIKLSNKYGNDI